jgi:hypothetical protein
VLKEHYEQTAEDAYLLQYSSLQSTKS